MTLNQAGDAPQVQRESLLGALWRQRRTALTIWLRFGLALGVLMLVSIWARPFTDDTLPAWLAVLSAGALRLMGVDATAIGTAVQSSIGTMTIIRECTAVYPTTIYCAAVLAHPSPWGRRLLGVVVGVLALQAVNIVRLLSLLYIAGRWPSIFEMAHLVAWQALIVLCAILFWIVWVSELAGTKKP